MSSEIMTETEARTFREASNAYIKRLDRMSRAALAAEYTAEQEARGRTTVYGGPARREEFMAALAEMRYPIVKFNEAGHVLYHTPAAYNSACVLCHAWHGDLSCDCGQVSLYAECGDCGHPRYKHGRPTGNCAVNDSMCSCPGYVTAGQVTS
jgi:hypothetical protein